MKPFSQSFVLKFAACVLLLPALASLAAQPALPTIPAGVYNVTNYGAIGDGVSTNTTAIQAAFTAAANSANHGGTVEIPPGIFLCGPLTFKSSVNLQIDAGAILRLLPYDKYPGGIVSPSDFITGSSLHDIEISGSGVIDGQGAPWWPGYKTNNRPTLVAFSSCNRVLIQNTTFSNAPAQNIAVKGRGGNVTIQNITELAPDSSAPTNASHNTDAIDLAGTNCVVQNCYLDVGDDNVAMGSSGGVSADILLTNLTCLHGHGISIGSYTSSGVSNITVINCTFNGTANGIRLKSDDDRGGVVQNLSYLNIGMTNVNFPFMIDSYYNEVSTPSSVTPSQAATMVGSTNTSYPRWRNLTLSNITAIAASGSIAGIVWGRNEVAASNLAFIKVNITASKSFDIYNAAGVRFVDSQINLPGGIKTFLLYNAQVTITNSTPSASVVSFDGLSTNSIDNSLALYNTPGSLSNTNAIDHGPLTLGGSTMAIGNNFAMYPATVLNFLPGTNASTVAVTGNLALGGTINLTNGPGFGPTNYTLLTYTGALNGSLPALGATPSGYNYSFDTNTPGQVKLIAAPSTSLTPVTLAVQTLPGQLLLSWPSDHTGWRLQIQTNSNIASLGTNWTDVVGSQSTNQVVLPFSPTLRSAFLRLIY